MKYYRNYKAKKFHVPGGLIVVLVSLLIIVAGTILFGNHLKKQLESAALDTSEIPTVDTSDPFDPDPDMPAAVHDEALLSVRGGYLDLSAIADAADLRSRVEAVASGGYNAVAFVVIDGEGMLTYASPAATAASRLPAKETLPTAENLAAAVSYAGELGLRACAVYTARPEDTEADCAIAAELAQAGFDEILIRGFEAHTALDGGVNDGILTYVRALRAAADIDLGVCLGQEVYTAAQYAPYIENLFRETEFLAIDLTAADGETVTDLAEKLQGSFSAYLLRTVLDGADAEASAAVKAALDSAKISGRLYISAPPSPQDDPAPDPDAPGED